MTVEQWVAGGISLALIGAIIAMLSVFLNKALKHVPTKPAVKAIEGGVPKALPSGSVPDEVTEGDPVDDGIRS